MFKCKNCGTSKLNQSQNKLVSVIREVEYLIQIKYERIKTVDNFSTVSYNYKTVKRTRGKEIVKEDSYCNKCLPKTFTPKIMEKVIREVVVASKLLKGYDKEAKGDKRHGRTRKDNQSTQ